MPVVEVTQLRLKGVSPDDPALLKNLSSVRQVLQTQSVFYSCIEDPSLLFILGLWPSLEAHADFLASPRARDVLKPQESMLEFAWALHMELDAMGSLPLEAPVMALTRRKVNGHDVDAYNKAMAGQKHALLETSKHKVVHGWRLDAAPGTQEALLFTGWQTPQAHVAFAARQTEDHRAGCALYDTLVHHHAWNLETTSG